MYIFAWETIYLLLLFFAQLWKKEMNTLVRFLQGVYAQIYAHLTRNLLTQFSIPRELFDVTLNRIITNWLFCFKQVCSELWVGSVLYEG